MWPNFCEKIPRLGRSYKIWEFFGLQARPSNKPSAPYPHSPSHSLDLAYGLFEQQAARIKEFWFWWKFLKLISYENKIYLIKVSPFLNFVWWFDLRNVLQARFRFKIFYRFGVPAANLLPERRTGPFRLTFTTASQWYLAKGLTSFRRYFSKTAALNTGNFKLYSRPTLGLPYFHHQKGEHLFNEIYYQLVVEIY